MGNTQKTGNYVNAIFQDTSNNIGIGGSPSGSYKFEVTGTAKVSSTLLVGSTLTANDGTFSGSGVDGSLGSVVRISTTNTNGNARNWALVNTFDSYGDLNFRLSTAQGGNALTAGSTVLTLSRTGAATFTNTVAAVTSISVVNSGAQEAILRATMSFADGYRAIVYLNNTHTGGLNYYIASTNNSDGQWGGGKLAISGNNGAQGVYLNGGTATSWTGQSDIRLKDIDSEIENAIDKVNKLRGIKFTWKSDETKKMQVGLIAQEVKEVLPEAVDFEEGNEDYKMGVQYTDLIPLLVNAIKELSAQNQDLKSRLDKAGL